MVCALKEERGKERAGKRDLKVGTSRVASGEDLSRIFTSFPGLSFQGPGLYWLVGTRVGGH